MKYISVLLLTAFLTGCGFNGIMPETYGGEPLETNTEAVELYRTENILMTEGMEDRYHFLSAGDIPTAGSPGEAVTIPAGSYDIGEDIEEGRYHAAVEMVGAGALVVHDENSDEILEVAISHFSDEIILDVTEGMTLEFKVREGEIELVPVDEMMLDAASENLVIPAGVHEAGSHFEPGEYALLSAELPVRRANGDNVIYADYKLPAPDDDSAAGDEFEEQEFDEPLVTFNEGDMIITEYPITMRKE